MVHSATKSLWRPEYAKLQVDWIIRGSRTSDSVQVRVHKNKHRHMYFPKFTDGHFAQVDGLGTSLYRKSMAQLPLCPKEGFIFAVWSLLNNLLILCQITRSMPGWCACHVPQPRQQRPFFSVLSCAQVDVRATVRCVFSRFSAASLAGPFNPQRHSPVEPCTIDLTRRSRRLEFTAQGIAYSAFNSGPQKTQHYQKHR